MEGSSNVNSHSAHRGSLLSAIFLVAGTCIGGGMLALPVSTGLSGFIPSTLMMALCWFAMTASALLLLEVNLWMRGGAHIMTMSSTLLGPIGAALSWCLYLFISYASVVAYTAAGGGLAAAAMNQIFSLSLSDEAGCLLFILIFGSILYLGNRIVGRANAVLFIAMLTAYVLLVTVGLQEVKMHFLRHTNWHQSFFSIPLLLTTFSFQTMLPSLTPYLQRNPVLLRWAIVGGTGLTFFVYLIWQSIVLGIVPVIGPHSLAEALEAGKPITQFLREHADSTQLSLLAEFFGFFALVTSFLGMAMGLKDFLADGLKIKHTKWGNVCILLLISVPTFFFSAFYERVFIEALETSGGFGDSILNGILPILMVWSGRYWYRFPHENRVPGGKLLLGGLCIFFVFALLVEIIVRTTRVGA